MSPTHLIQSDVDDATIEIPADVLRVKDNGITAAKLAHAIDATGIGFDADKVDGKQAAVFALKVGADDIERTDATKGYILRDTQAPAHKWRFTVDNTGNLITTDLGVA